MKVHFTALVSRAVAYSFENLVKLRGQNGTTLVTRSALLDSVTAWRNGGYNGATALLPGQRRFVTPALVVTAVDAFLALSSTERYLAVCQHAWRTAADCPAGVYLLDSERAVFAALTEAFQPSAPAPAAPAVVVTISAPDVAGCVAVVRQQAARQLQHLCDVRAAGSHAPVNAEELFTTLYDMQAHQWVEAGLPATQWMHHTGSRALQNAVAWLRALTPAERAAIAYPGRTGTPAVLPRFDDEPAPTVAAPAVAGEQVVTTQNLNALCARFPPDQRVCVEPGARIWSIQVLFGTVAMQGCMTVYPHGRGAIYEADGEPSVFGEWDEELGMLLCDEPDAHGAPRWYDRQGHRVSMEVICGQETKVQPGHHVQAT